jgi:hypothetical protein
MSGIKQITPAGMAVAALIAVAWVVVILLLLQFYFDWKVIQAIGNFMLAVL